MNFSERILHLIQVQTEPLALLQGNKLSIGYKKLIIN